MIRPRAAALVADEQRALFAGPVSIDEILRAVERWPDQRRYCFWERVMILGEGVQTDENIRKVWGNHVEGGG